jgi:hypothetical protein
MPTSGIAFVSARRGQQDAHLFKPMGATLMCLERIARNLGFALAAATIVAGFGFTIEYLPVISVLAQ